MKHLLQQLIDTHQRPYGAIVFAGAGTGTELGYLRQLSARRLVLLEPNPQLAMSLRDKLLADRGEELLDAGLACERGFRPLYIFNNTRESSFIDAAGLKDYFPNLRKVRQIEVECQTLSDLAVRFDIDGNAENVLILEIPGLEGPLLVNTNEGHLHLFSSIIVRTNEDALYDNESYRQAICDRLAEAGFRLSAVDPDCLYPHTELLFRRDDESVNRKRLMLQVQSQAELIQSLQKQLDGLEVANNELRQKNEGLSQKHVANIAELTADRDAKAKLAEERAAQIASLEKTCDEQARRVTELHAQTEQEQSARDEQVKLVAKGQASIVALNQEKVELAAKCDVKAKLAEERAIQIETLKKACDEQVRLANERHTQFEQVEKERDEQIKLASERQASIDALKKEKAELVDARDTKAKLVEQRQGELVALSKAKEDQAKLNAELQVQIKQLMLARDEQSKLAVERQANVEALTKEKTELAALHHANAKLAEQRQTEIDALMKAQVELAELSAQRQARVEELVQASNEQARLAADREARLETVRKEKVQLETDRDAKAKLAEQRQAEIEALRKTKDEQARLSADRDAQLQQMTQARDEQATLAAERKVCIETREAELKKANSQVEESTSRIAGLEVQLEEFKFRQSLLNQEMIKAEAQIGLIKDVLLREPGI